MSAEKKNPLWLLSGFIEVFPSNLDGVHSRGHSRHAAIYRGALNGHHAGLQGQSYAIPVREHPYSKAPLPLNSIKQNIAEFYECALENGDKRFIVSRLNAKTNITDEEMIHLIGELGAVPTNVRWVAKWMAELAPERFRAGLIIAGSRSLGPVASDEQKAEMAEAVRQTKDKYGSVFIISGVASTGPDVWGRDFGAENGIPVVDVPAEWDVFGRKTAGFIRNQFMAMMGVAVQVFIKDGSSGSADMVDTAIKDGLDVETIVL